MSMVFEARRVPAKMIDDLIRGPDVPTGIFGKVTSLLRKPPSVDDRIMAFFQDETVPGFNIDWEWYGLYFALTGVAEHAPLPQGGMLDGKPVGDQVGWGQAMRLHATDVVAFADHLRQVDREELRKRLDPIVLNEANIYPLRWDEMAPGAIDSVLDHLAPMLDFYSEAAQARQDVLSALF